jgi:3',5'-cyclic AMP phosphodiesterase CpdA
MSASLRFAHISDTHIRPDAIGRSQVFIDHLAEIQAGDYHFVVHTGDLMDEPSAWAARAFHAIISQLQIPIYFVPGNHDVDNPRLGEIQAPWWARLAVDSSLEAQFRGWFGPTWHTFTCQGVHLAAFDSQIINSGLPEEKAQWKWLEETLADIASRQPEHLFLFTHLPLFIHHPYERLDPTDFSNPYLVIAPPGRDRLLRLIRQYGVDAVFSGHIHAPWQRSHTWPEGVTTQFISTGSSGVPSAMAIEHFNLPLSPDQGLGYHEHRVTGDGLFSRYHQHTPVSLEGRWKLGKTWTTHCLVGQTPPLQQGLGWHQIAYRASAPDWQESVPRFHFPLVYQEGMNCCVRQMFVAEDGVAAVYLELLTERAVEIYLNGELLYGLELLAHRPPAWRSASGTYTIDSPVLHLGLNQRLVRRGENVLALLWHGEVAAHRGKDADEYIAYRKLEQA